MPELVINPPPSELGRVNAVVSGRARQYEVRDFRGPLSVKTTVCGSAIWESEAGQFDVTPGVVLVLNDGEEYSVTIDSLQPVETFCIFFERGFVEDAARAGSTSHDVLLDEPFDRGGVEFAERMQFRPELIAAVEAVRNGDSPYPLAELLVQTRRTVEVPAARASTRNEIRRRLDAAVSFIHGNLGRSILLADVARAAALSPFHFHRLFRATWRETVHDYITRLRIERARALLRGTDRTVAEVAFDCGFESVGSFTTLFTRRCGRPLAQFRKIGEDAAAIRK